MHDADLPPVPDPADAIVTREALQARLHGLPAGAHRAGAAVLADLDDEAIAPAMDTTQSTLRATAARALAALRSGDLTDVKEAR